MTLFASPEHEPYRKLCRELRLEREFATFDAVLQPDGIVLEWGWWTETQTHGDRVEDLVWLPRSDQLDDMLEAAGIQVVEIEHRDGAYIALGAQDAYDCEWSCHAERAAGATREEAKLRLWCAVTGRAVVA